MTIRQLWKNKIYKICREDDVNGNYIECPEHNFFLDKHGIPSIFYCNLRSPEGKILKYGQKVDVDKDGYCAKEKMDDIINP